MRERPMATSRYHHHFRGDATVTPIAGTKRNHHRYASGELHMHDFSYTEPSADDDDALKKLLLSQVSRVHHQCDVTVLPPSREERRRSQASRVHHQCDVTVLPP